jgi:hypothetical protein
VTGEALRNRRTAWRDRPVNRSQRARGNHANESISDLVAQFERDGLDHRAALKKAARELVSRAPKRIAVYKRTRLGQHLDYTDLHGSGLSTFNRAGRFAISHAVI